MDHPPTANDSGFTLVELAIVLVIIGLILGGVLLGQDLIRAAQIRSTISQLDRYGTAVNAFRDKYRYLPGDIGSTPALNFGLVTRNGAPGRGDGNSLIEGGAANATLLSGETAIFWRDLYDTQLIDNVFSAADDTAAITYADPDAGKAYLPDAKLSRGNSITVYAQNGKNFFHISGFTSVAAGVYTVRAAMSPIEATNIDAKIDDGLPLTGAVRAYSNVGVADAAAAPTTGVCITDGSGINTQVGSYNNETDAIADTPACGLRIRMN